MRSDDRDLCDSLTRRAQDLTDDRLADLSSMCDECSRGDFRDEPSRAEFGDIAAALTRLRVLERAIGDSRHWWHDQHDAVAISVTLGGGAVPRGATLNDAIAAASKEVQP